MAKRPASKKTSARRTAPARKAATTRGARRTGATKKAAPKAAKKAGTVGTVRKAGTARKARTVRKAATSGAAKTAALFAPLSGAELRNIGHVRLEVGRAGAARVKRMIYPAGFHWAADMKPITGTDLCMHAHVGFLAHGEIHIEYADGCVVEFKAPQVVEIAPGHDGWVVGTEPVVLIEIDFERETAAKLGLIEHKH